MNAVNFPASDVATFVDGLHANGQHFVPIVDPGIKTLPGYPAHDDGVAADLFIKDILGGDAQGQVWPGPTNFPDFLHPKSTVGALLPPDLIFISAFCIVSH